MLTPQQAALSILVMALVTLLTRALPFLLFGRGHTPPRVVLYLGQVLPPAVIAMLVVYCVRYAEFGHVSQWAPALLASATVVLLHLWKRNNLLSIFGGTILYMVLVQTVFLPPV